MVNSTSIDKQLKNIGFSSNRWNRAECLELSSIILPDEKIFECVNGWYENGFALLCATDIRILLVDKKIFKYLTIEDLRFDTINQIDYSHRLLDAQIVVSAGMKSLKFRSYNKIRLRKLIGHVQHRMAEVKRENSNKAQDHQEHLDKIDDKLQSYILSQLSDRQHADGIDEGRKSSNVLSNYKKIIRDNPNPVATNSPSSSAEYDISSFPQSFDYGTYISSSEVTSVDLVNAAVKEIFNKRQPISTVSDPTASTVTPKEEETGINPLMFAYRQVLALLRSRNYGRATLQPTVLAQE
jgi:hypothetical protein